jgi:hypothetical protein
MRAAVGDLCVVVTSVFPQNVSKLVTVLSRSNHDNYDWLVLSLGSNLRGTSNITGGVISRPRLHVLDSQLRPIRDQEGRDESLRNLLLIST